MTTLLIATRNTHKVGEIRTILGGDFEYRSLADFPDAPKTIENAGSFFGNATKKAIELARWLVGRPGADFRKPGKRWFVLADDSGLEVDALNGAPGVHSARFAALDDKPGGPVARAENSADARNNTKLLHLLKGIPMEKRSARFRCVLALTPVIAVPARNSSPVCYTDEFELQTTHFDGKCEGRIGFEPQGQNGFGYDPLFLPNGFRQTFAELGEETKNKLSHRAVALAKLKLALANEMPGTIPT